MASKIRERNKAIFLLTITFGISSWVVFSGILVETPLLIYRLPESWKLPSMILVVSQLAQIGPITLFFLKCMCCSCWNGRTAKAFKKRQIPDRFIIYVLLIIGLAACSALARYWDRTAHIFGENRSVAFFTCIFFLAILDCTCTIVFLTYCGDFKGNYITSLYIGEGISSLLPSLFALMQGTGDQDTTDCSSNLSSANLTAVMGNNHTAMVAEIKQPRFSISVYFWLLCSTLVVSFISFLLLDFWPSFKKEKLGYIRKRKHELGRKYERQDIGENGDQDFIKRDSKDSVAKRNEEPTSNGSTLDKMVLLFAITLVSFILYGFIPGVSSYSALPYGLDTMHLCVTLSLITQPISSLIATFFEIKTTRSICFWLLVSMGISSYILAMSIKSPCPLLLGHWLGPIVMITSWILSFGLLMYLRCCIASALKRNHGEKSLAWCGLLTQVGQFMGSLLIYLLVDYLNVFKEAEKCRQTVCSQ